MNWIYYLLEANLYLSVFYLFYRLVLHKETFYIANRFYLLGSSAIAFSLPFLKIGFFSKEVVQPQQFYYKQSEVQNPFFSLENVLIIIYGSVAILLLIKLLYGFKRIISLIKQYDVKQENGIKFIELSDSKTAFSFFTLLFIDPNLPQKSTVIKHELVHIHQKHSIDVMIFEILQILNWFNPLLFFLKKDVKLIHEYLADESTVNQNIAKYDYAMFLIQNTCDKQNLSLINQIFNSSILKQRITMLNQKKSAKWARLRLLIALPLAGAMVCASTMAFTKNYGVLDLYPKTSRNIFTPKQTTPKKTKAKEIVIAEPVKQLPPPPPIEPQPVKKLKYSTPKATANKSLKLKMVPPPPPSPPKEPKAAKGEVLEIKLAPPPPPVENKNLNEHVVKGYPAKGVKPIARAPKSQEELKPIKVEGYKSNSKQTVNPPLNPTPAKKKYDKDDVIYGEVIPGT
ncbi:M56 family metallopeptidase [Pedobacter aquatilis]|uniref:M56 family metallopeptidase n=1 Tax=Pedobacter aquatilis TaxID=351343 RepID=UPI0025B3111C|nr:M56 family metallopeptidase [Pedobacter aquatilis]MDN3585209.1 M56 family metallopeptidase [Pedobacter aquatilis]